MSHRFTHLLRSLKPKRRWAQFSLGTLLAVVTVLGVLLGLVTRAAHRQRSAVAAISRLGGHLPTSIAFSSTCMAGRPKGSPTMSKFSVR
jgi:hypothetical protein